jgi:thioredoxin-related protein
MTAARTRRTIGTLCLCGALFPAVIATAQVASPHAIDIPSWFTESFLDIKEEAATAARDGKRVMLYFGQDGCPYCRELMTNNFSQRPIVEKTRKHFVAIALNLFGDREVTWVDGQRMSEKNFARLLKVQFTPTLLFIDGDGRVVTRLNGYHPPHRLSAVLDYVAGGMESRLSLSEHLAGLPADPARPSLNEQPFFMKPPFDLRRRSGSRPLAVIFESRSCLACDEMHREGLQRTEVRAQVSRFDVARFALNDNTEVVTPSGQRRSASAWARELNVIYTPTWLFFDARSREVFRVEGHVRPFHLATSLEYVASGAYRSEPEFQRFIRAKAERLRAAGKPVDLMK